MEFAIKFPAVTLLILYFIIESSISQVEQNIPISARIDSGLSELLQIQKKIKHIHPFLENFHPIAIHSQKQLYIYDYDTLSCKYNFVKNTPPPFPLVDGIRASFPLSVYDGKPTCIVSPDIFDSLEEIVLIFHEFIHCTQANTVEFKIKNELAIHQQAMQNNDFMWELNHKFPYSDSLFIKYYDELLNAINLNDHQKVEQSRESLKNHLKEIDFEYMVWQEWKEGLARYIENKIKCELGLEQNFYGKEKPYHRISFYYGGEALLVYLFGQNESLYSDLEMLFEQLYSL